MGKMSKKCFRCFTFFGEGDICPRCGYDVSATSMGAQWLQPGEKLGNGRYEVGCVVGAGGFGITYSAWDNVLGIRVAIKEYLPGEFSTRIPGNTKVTIYGGEKEEQFSEGLKKFYEESVRLAKFREVPGVVQIYESFMENETAYIVMEYLEGETLAERIKREKTIPPEEATEIILPVLDALECVHKEGIIHRDIAPNNIFLCKDGQVKLLDFGAARSATGTHSKSLTVLYKEGYTAEEQYRSRGEQGPWTDVYSVAASLYKAITGVTPDGVMERHRKDKLKAPCKYSKGISVNMSRAIMNAMNMDLRKRTQTAADFKKELLSAKKVSKKYKRTHEVRVGRIPVWVWCVSVASIAIIAVMGGLLLTGRIEFHAETFSNFFMENGKVRMMNVVNLEEEEANNRLKKLGLSMEITEYKYTNKVQAGRIISQEEDKGEIVNSGTIVHVVVSKGAGEVEIPEMVNRAFTPYIEELKELCLNYEEEYKEYLLPPGYVISTIPNAGEKLLQGETVKITISSGMGYDPNADGIVPDLLEKTTAEANDVAGEQGFFVMVKGEEYSDNIPEGLIMEQDVAAGNIMKGDSIVNVVVSKGIEQFEVPLVEGMTSQEATKVLEECFFVVNTEKEISMEVPEGTIISQSLNSGENVDKYTEITLKVAISGYEVPNLIGKTLEEAIAICDSEGYSYSMDYMRGGNGTVSTQTPASGKLIEKKVSITFYVGISNQEFTNKILELINEKRRNEGMGALSLDANLTKFAEVGAAENVSSDYATGAIRPNGERIFDMVRAAGIGGGLTYTTRKRATYLNDTNSRLKYETDMGLLDSRFSRIGVAYSDTNMIVMFIN